MSSDDLNGVSSRTSLELCVRHDEKLMRQRSIVILIMVFILNSNDPNHRFEPCVSRGEEYGEFVGWDIPISFLCSFFHCCCFIQMCCLSKDFFTWFIEYTTSSHEPAEMRIVIMGMVIPFASWDDRFANATTA